MKYIALSLGLIASMVSMVCGQDLAGVQGGKMQEGACKTGSITQIGGKLQTQNNLIAKDKKFLNQIWVKCSNGESFNFGKSEGTDFALAEIPSGVRSATVVFTDSVNVIVYGDTILEVSQANSRIVLLADRSGNGCPVNGVKVTSEEGKGILAIGFTFQCSIDSQIAETISKVSGDPVPRGKFDWVTKEMKRQYDESIKKVRDEFYKILETKKGQSKPTDQAPGAPAPDAPKPDTPADAPKPDTPADAPKPDTPQPGTPAPAPNTPAPAPNTPAPAPAPAPAPQP